MSKYAIINTESNIIENVIKVDPNNLPTVGKGYSLIAAESWMNPGEHNVRPPKQFRSFYKWDADSADWVMDFDKKQEALTELTSRFNAATKSLIENSTVTYSNSNGSIAITCDSNTQQNFTALYVIRKNQSVPYEVWEKNTSIELASVEEIEELCQMVMANVETIRRERKAIRDTFSDMAMPEIIATLSEL